MANFTSQVQQYQQALPTYAFDVISKGLQYKQQAFDQNVERNQALISEYANIDLARDVDKQYLGQKIDALVSGLNSMEGASAQNTQAFVQGKIRSVVDNNVITAATSTKNFRKLQADIEYFKTKETDKYSTLNEAFAMRGANAWLTNNTVGSGYGGGVYNPYEDVNKSMLAVVKDLKETKGDQVIEVPVVDAQGNHRLQKKTIKGMTSEEIQAYLPNLMPPTTQQQLQINGWAKYQGNGGLQAAQTVFDQYTQQSNSRLDKGIETARVGETATGVSKSVRDAYSRQKQALIKQKSDLNAQLSQVNREDTVSIGGFIENNRWLNNFAQIAGARESVEYDTDTAYYSQKGLELDYVRENRAQKESQIGMIKTGLEIQKLQNELTPAQNPISLSPDVKGLEENIDPYASTQRAYAEASNQVTGLASPILNEASTEKRNLFNDKKAQYLSQNYTEAGATTAAFRDIFSQSNPEAYNRILEAENTRVTQFKVLEKADSEAVLREFEENGATYFKDLNTLAGVRPEVSKFIKDNGITAQTLSDRNNSKLIFQATKILDDTGTPTGMYSNRALAEYGGSPNTVTRDNPKRKARSRASGIIAELGYSGFSEGRIANFNSKEDRQLLANASPQIAGSFSLDANKPISAKLNADNSFTLTQVVENTKDGEIVTSLREVAVPSNSTAADFIRSRISPNANKQQRLSGVTPSIVRNISYIDDNSSKSLRKNADFITQASGGARLNSGIAPENYLTKAGTEQMYKAALRGRVSEDKIERLTQLMEEKGNKIVVKTGVEDGQYTVQTYINSIKPYDLGEYDAGNEQNTAQINLFVNQYPQITAGDTMLQYLAKNPKQIDSVINALEE